MDQALVKLTSCWSVEQAYLIKNRLEEEGIATYLNGEMAASTLWHISSATGRAQIFVAEQDLERAVDILKDNVPVDTGDHKARFDRSEAEGGSEPDFTMTDEEDYETPLSKFGESCKQFVSASIVTMLHFMGLALVLLLLRLLLFLLFNLSELPS